MQQTIDDLRLELKTINETSIAALRETSNKGHELLMQEKVNSINFQAKIDSVTRLLAAIENNVLSDFQWSRVGELTDIINKYEKIKIFKQALEVSYELKTVTTTENLKHLKNAILREAAVRLFDCNITLQTKKED